VKVRNKKVGDTGNKWGECTASPPKPTVTHHLKLIGTEEKHSKERAMRVEFSATGRPKPRQEKRQRARRQTRLGTVKFQSAYTDFNLCAYIKCWFCDWQLEYYLSRIAEMFVQTTA